MALMNEWLQGFDAPLGSFGGGNATLRDILDKLLWRTKEQHKRVPVVTLSLSTGRELTGALVAHSEREPRVLTLAMGRGADRELAFVSTNAVVGIVVHDVGELDRPPPGVEIVGKLELARRAKALGEKYGVDAAVDIAGDDESARHAVQILLPALDEVLGKITADADGKSAWKAKVSALVVRAAGGVSLDGKRLLVSSADARAIEALL